MTRAFKWNDSTGREGYGLAFDDGSKVFYDHVGSYASPRADRGIVYFDAPSAPSTPSTITETQLEEFCASYWIARKNFVRFAELGGRDRSEVMSAMRAALATLGTAAEARQRIATLEAELEQVAAIVQKHHPIGAVKGIGILEAAEGVRQIVEQPQADAGDVPEELVERAAEAAYDRVEGVD